MYKQLGMAALAGAAAYGASGRGRRSRIPQGTVRSGRFNDLGDELVAFPGYSDRGEKGWFVGEQVNHPGRDPFVTPKIFFRGDGGKADALDVVRTEEFWGYPDAKGRSARGRRAKTPGRLWKTVSGIKIYRDSEWDQYVVVPDPGDEASWYYTDDREDAVGTAKAQARAMGGSARGRRAPKSKFKVGDRVKFRGRWGRETTGKIVATGGKLLGRSPIWVIEWTGANDRLVREHILEGDVIGVVGGRSAKGRRAAPTTKQRRKMGQKLMALPWDQASWTYKKNHTRYRGIGGYPMDTKLRASGARSYAIAAYNDGKLTKKDVQIIFRRTSRRYPSMPKFDGIVCQKTRKNANRRKCRSQTSR